MDIGKISGNSIGDYAGSAVRTAGQASEDSFVKRLEAASHDSGDKELMKVCQEFEAIMLDMMFKQMKATVVKSDLIEQDPGTEIFESMRDEQLMQQASKTGTLGLAQSLYKQLSGRRGKTAEGGAAIPAAKAPIRESGLASEED